MRQSGKEARLDPDLLAWPYHVLDGGMEDEWPHTQIPLQSSAETLELGSGAV